MHANVAGARHQKCCLHAVSPAHTRILDLVCVNLSDKHMVTTQRIPLQVGQGTILERSSGPLLHGCPQHRVGLEGETLARNAATHAALAGLQDPHSSVAAGPPHTHCCLPHKIAQLYTLCPSS